MKETKRQLLLYAGFLCSGLLVLGMITYPIWKHAPKWVEIKDPNTLISECAALLETQQAVEITMQTKDDFRLRSLPEEIWPDSIKKLKPVAVFPDEDHIKIHLHGGGIKRGWVYLVYPDKRTETVAPKGLVLYGNVAPGIFRYKTDG